MWQLCTAQFITDTGFATGITPTVTINEALTGTLVGVFNMVETSVGNYVYNFSTSDDNLVYFFKYDSGTDDTLNRYMGNNNKIEKAVIASGWGGTIVNNNGMTKKEMEKLVQMILESLPEDKEIVLDTSKIEEKLGLIDKKIQIKEVDFDYWLILSSNEKNSEKILNKIDKIKIPQYNEQKVIDEIKNIEKVDISKMENKINKIYPRLEKLCIKSDIEDIDKKEPKEEDKSKMMWNIIDVVEKSKKSKKTIDFSSLLNKDGWNSQS